MRRNIVFALLLTIVAQGVWAYNPRTMSSKPTEGPWTFDAVRCGTYAYKGAYSLNGLNKNAWEADWDSGDNDKRAYQWQDDDGTGFTMHCHSGNFMSTNYFGVYSTYTHSESLEPYTAKRLTWKFKIRGRSQKASQVTALYACDDLSALKNLVVDFTGDYSNKSGKEYCIAYLVQRNNPDKPNSRIDETESQTKTFYFDNRDADTARTIKWSIMMTHVVYNSSNATFDMHQWGSFKHVSSSWKTYYYKYITFDANGGEGSMEVQTIENSGNLTANTFTRAGYTFAGWATAPNGEVVYTDAEAITVNSDSKGLATLYAKWNIENYTIAYNLDGGSATNPTNYTVETETFTLNNPTKADYTFIGWAEGSLDEPQMEVTIEKGSTGDKTYTANWINSDAYNARTLINAIGEVEYTAESKAKIDAARAAYDALEEKKALLTAVELETLLKAEAAYAALGKSTINFVSKDAAQIVDTKQEALYYPAAPEVDGFTFRHWQPLAEDITGGKILIQAVYE